MSAASVKPGDVVAGKYRVVRVLGQGGMGIVLAATDLEGRLRFALKLMRPNTLSNPEAVERFLREARATSRLVGQHIARVHEAGRQENGAPFMAMEYLEGSDMRAVIKRRGALPLREALSCVMQICEALAEAHANDVIHRDLKPANVFLAKQLSGNSIIKVLDFGVSKIVGDAAGQSDVTKSYVMIGSPHYMSPEQMRSSRDVDARTDIWSLGVIFYQLLTGRLPFEGAGLTQIITSVLQGAPPPPSQLVKGVPPELDDVIMRCLETEVDRRWPNVVELARALSPFMPQQRSAPRSSILPYVGVLIVLLLALGGVMALVIHRGR